MAGESQSHVTIVEGDHREVSGILSGAVFPGYLLEPTSADDTWRVHSNTGAPALLAVAREQFENNGAGIEDQIASGDSVTVCFPEKGAVILCVAEATIQRGDFVSSAGDGRVEEADSSGAFGIAIDNTYDHGALLRVAVQVI